MKKFCMILALALMFSFLLSCTPAEEPPIGGDPLSRDEVPQEEVPATPTPEPEGFIVRTDVTIEDLRYNELGRGYFWFTMVNHTDEPMADEMYFYVQKKVNGQWKYVPFIQDRWHSVEEYLWFLGKRECFLESISCEHFPGEFRLLFGKTGNIRIIENDAGERELSIEKGAELIVGHITVTEAPQFGSLVEKDGLLQSELITVSDVYYADGRVHYTVKNSSDFSPHINRPWAQKKIDGEWQNVGLIYYPQVDRGEYAKHLPMQDEVSFSIAVDSDYTELAGEYRLYFGWHLAGGATNMTQRFEKEDFYIVGYLTIE